MTTPKPDNVLDQTDQERCVRRSTRKSRGRLKLGANLSPDGRSSENCGCSRLRNGRQTIS
jgi:hypothetical protein